MKMTRKVYGSYMISCTRLDPSHSWSCSDCTHHTPTIRRSHYILCSDFKGSGRPPTNSCVRVQSASANSELALCRDAKIYCQQHIATALASPNTTLPTHLAVPTQHCQRTWQSPHNIANALGSPHTTLPTHLAVPTQCNIPTALGRPNPTLPLGSPNPSRLWLCSHGSL
jgi:hypothetical protein